jgi:hypothetical protein
MTMKMKYLYGVAASSEFSKIAKTRLWRRKSVETYRSGDFRKGRGWLSGTAAQKSCDGFESSLSLWGSRGAHFCAKYAQNRDTRRTENRAPLVSHPLCFRPVQLGALGLQLNN